MWINPCVSLFILARSGLCVCVCVGLGLVCVCGLHVEGDEMYSRLDCRFGDYGWGKMSRSLCVCVCAW